MISMIFLKIIKLKLKVKNYHDNFLYENDKSAPYYKLVIYEDNET